MGSTPYPMNEYAPSYFQGLNLMPSAELGYDPRPFTYLYNPPSNFGGAGGDTSLVTNDSVQIDVDSDFLMMAWYLALTTGEFQIQLADSTGYNLMSGAVNSGAISNSSSDPTVFSPAHPFPAGGRIQIVELEDLSGELNPTQIAFVGIKLFRVKRQG